MLWPPNAKKRPWVIEKKTLMLEKIEDKKERGPQRVKWLDRITDSMDMNLSKFQEIVEDRGARCEAIHGVTKLWT